MSSIVERSRVGVGARCVAVAMISAGFAGCSTDAARLTDNSLGSPHARTASATPNEVTGSLAPVSAAPVGRVEGAPLAASASLPPPPIRVASAVHTPAPTYAAPPTSVQRTAAAPVLASPARPSAPSGVHVVAPHETMITIAKHYGTTPAAIVRANNLKSASIVKLGQRLVIPGVGQERIKTATAAPQPVAHPAPAPARPQLAAAKPAKTAQAPQPTKLASAAAQPLVAPKPAAPAAAPKAMAAAPAPQKTAAAVPAQPAPAPTKVASLEPAATARMATPASAAADDAKEAAAGPGFRWPVRGRVIAGFGPRANGQQNDGINVAVPEGTSVKAAEDGVVAYAGNELKGYGNLVLVRHSNGYVTAYAHASELSVKRGDTVKRGQIIAKSGQTGTVTSPQLHFEVRKGSTPVDPTQFLSGT